MEFYDYQKKLLKSYEDDRFVLVKHSRQMGITTTLIEHMINLLTKYENKKIIFVSNNLDCARHVLNKIKLDSRMVDKIGKKPSIISISLLNGNELYVTSSIGGFKRESFTDIIVDNAAFVKDLNGNIAPILASNGNIILCSGNKKGETFFNNLFKDDKNVFKKHLIHWKENPNYDEKWENDFKKYMGVEAFDVEFNLLDTSKVKDKKIMFRLNNDDYTILTNKMTEKGMSISEYLRYLIRNS
jgi:hypothetical protein